MTFSIVARCAKTGMFGVDVSSSSPAVAARCAYAQAGAGAVASQNVTDPTLGVRGLKLLARGASAEETVAILKRTGAYTEYRQVLVVDGQGGTAIHSGPNALGIWAEAKAENVACGGNLLAHDGIPQAMVDGFLASEGHLGDRLIAAMRAGLRRRGRPGALRRHEAGARRLLAGGRSALRLDGRLPHRGTGEPLGDLQAAARRLRDPRHQPFGSAELRRSRRRMTLLLRSPR